MTPVIVRLYFSIFVKHDSIIMRSISRYFVTEKGEKLYENVGNISLIKMRFDSAQPAGIFRT
jgi:predicted transcriptional regulator